jgi:hypothetical protein
MVFFFFFGVLLKMMCQMSITKINYIQKSSVIDNKSTYIGHCGTLESFTACFRSCICLYYESQLVFLSQIFH